MPWAGRQGAGGAALAALLLCACRTAPRAARAAPPPPPPKQQRVVAVPPQPGKVIAEVNGIAVLALSLPDFARLSRDQRLLALEVAKAGAAGEEVALDQAWRHDLALVHVLRAILSRPLVVPPALLARIGAFARLVWLNGGMHDAQTGRKQQPPFSAADLRTAALAAQAAGADFKLGTVSLELALRALEAPLFDPGVDPLRAANERSPAIRLPAAAAALDGALAYAAPPQAAVLGPLASFLRTGEPDAFREAQRAWVDAAGAVDFFAGFFDRSFDPRARKAIFGAFAGLREGESTALLQRLAQLAPRFEEKLPWAPSQRRLPRPPVVEALSLAAASGTMLPLRSFGVTLPLDPAEREASGVKTALFAGAEEAVARVRTDAALRILADPRTTTQLAPCLPSLRLTSLALGEIGTPPPTIGEMGTPTPTRAGEANDEVTLPLFADLVADFLSADPLVTEAGLLDETCQRLWPQFAAASLLMSFADVPAGDRVDGAASRAHQLELWWFTSKGALVEQRDGKRRFFAVPDAARFHAAAGELLQLLHGLQLSGDGARLAVLLQQHATRLDTHLRDEVLERLRAAGIPRRVAVIPPRLVPVLADGKLQDAQAAPVEDLDAEILRRWQAQ